MLAGLPASQFRVVRTEVERCQFLHNGNCCHPRLVRNHFGDTKTEASRQAGSVAPFGHKMLWPNGASASPYKGDEDFLFPSLRKNGKQPLMPDMVLREIIRPALASRVTGKVIGWHSFRHSLATNLRGAGSGCEVAQELLRHANSRTTMDLYTQAVSADKRSASLKQVELLLA